MKFYFEMLKFLVNKYIKRYETGKAVKIFCENMGLAYIKFAQIYLHRIMGIYLLKMIE